MGEITKLEMYDFLADNIGLGQETMDVIVQVMGDTPETYKRVLRKTSEFHTFEEAVAAFQTYDGD